jgi:hypothetical protein
VKFRLWLLDSDPAIRWQAMRDLILAPENEVVAERARVAAEGWRWMKGRTAEPLDYAARLTGVRLVFRKG